MIPFDRRNSESVANLFYEEPTTPENHEDIPPPDGSAEPRGSRTARKAREGEPTTDVVTDETEDILFGDTEGLVTSYEPSLADSLDYFSDHVEITEDQRRAAISEAAIVFSDARIPPDEASRIHGHIVRHAVEPADDATREAWATESRRELRERYGPAEAERRPKAARTFISNRPGLRDLLNATGVGSHPDLVLALADRANRLRLAPRGTRTRTKNK
jgi:hypothetical protein